MNLFNRKAEEGRSIDDILKPKTDGDDCESPEDVVGESDNESKSVSKDIQIETPQEVSFNALTCFGWSETKTPKWLIKCAHFWYAVMSFFWFLLGALTFAPIIFIQKKINVIFKDKLKSFIVAVCIYATFVILIIVLFATRNADKASEVANMVDDTLSLT